ncbi:RagB/SusD family nutrient uptake outer membrane protein, partial [termite gut metagenome]
MLRKIYTKWTICICTCICVCIACSDYLDVVPDDGIATLENAFAMRSEAERYLFTCYSYMPHDGNLNSDPAIMGGDEIWTGIDLTYIPVFNNYVMFNIARGLQNKTSPIGGGNWASLYQAIRVCNIFLENINSVPDIKEGEKMQWIAEATFLKAYYHFYLVRMYGPIPIIRKNLPISAVPEEVKVSRDPVDECFDYIVELLNEALPWLPPTVINPVDESGRITQPIAAALKAKVLITAASPLFNG